MVHRHEVTDDQWKLVEPLLAAPRARTGRPRRFARDMLNGVLWILRTGAPWRDLPERFGPWETVYGYFKTWRSRGTFDRILEALQIRLDRDGRIDWDLWCIDGTHIRASRAAAGAPKKVVGDTSKNPETTLWGVREADSAARSTWLLTVRAFPSPRKSPPVRPTTPRVSNR